MNKINIAKYSAKNAKRAMRRARGKVDLDKELETIIPDIHKKASSGESSLIKVLPHMSENDISCIAYRLRNRGFSAWSDGHTISVYWDEQQL